MDSWLAESIECAQLQGDHASTLRFSRDRSLILLGFWRGFRSDELARLTVENVKIVSAEGMTCYLDRSKSDRQALGKTYKCPSLSKLCPVTTLTQWVTVATLDRGPVYRGVDRWGHLSNKAMHPNSLIPVLRNMLSLAGVPQVEGYSSHSFRRGFAGWANASGWNIKELMEYVGWTDIKSAMRYFDTPDAELQSRFEQGLEKGNPKNE